jgi:hypothetical protein
VDTSTDPHYSPSLRDILRNIPCCRGEIRKGTNYAAISIKSSDSISSSPGTPLPHDLTSQSNFFSTIAAFSVIYNLPLFYQVVLDLNAANAGIRLIPNSIGASLGSLGYGMLMAKFVPPLANTLIRDDIIGLVCQRICFNLLGRG